MLGAGLLARRTAAVAAKDPRGQSAAVLIRWTLDTCVEPRPRTGIRVIGHLPESLDLHGTRGYLRRTGFGRPVAAAAGEVFGKVVLSHPLLTVQSGWIRRWSFSICSRNTRNNVAQYMKRIYCKSLREYRRTP